MGVIRSMRSRRRYSALVALLTLLAMPAGAQTVATYDKATIGGDTLPADVFRLVGLGNIGSGSGTINPLTLDNLGDVREDTTTTVSTAGAWTWGGAGSFTSTLAVTGTVTGGSGVFLLASPARISTTSPTFRLHESDAGTDEKYWELLADNDTLTLRAINDALGSSNALFNVQRTALVPGDWRWGSLLGTVRPENNGGTALGSETKKYLTVHAWELWVQTLVAKQTIATIGGRIMVAPTTTLVLDVAVSDAFIFVEHNDIRSGDTVMLQSNGKFEKMLITTGYLDCRVSGNCAGISESYAYGVTRNRDGTGANTWAAGDAVVNEGATGDGYIDMFSDRSATAEGYPGQVVSDGPIGYWRMAETSASQSADVMGSVGAAVENGTPSNGLGQLALSLGANNETWQNTGADGYLTVANSAPLQITGDLTLEWVMFWENDLARPEVILSRNTTGEFHVQVSATGALSFSHGNGSSSTAVNTSAGYVVPDQWHHYAIVRDAASSPKRILFYKDGVLTDSFTYTQAVTTSTNTLGIGENAISGTGTSELDGYLDEVAIYNYQLSADRILLHSQARTSTAISKFTIGPTICGNVRTGSGAFESAERWCVGNLAGTYGYSSTGSVYGLAAGNSSTTWVSVDAANGFRVMNGSTTKLQADTSGNLTLTGDITRPGAYQLTGADGLLFEDAGGSNVARMVRWPSNLRIMSNGVGLLLESNNSTGAVVLGVQSASVPGASLSVNTGAIELNATTSIGVYSPLRPQTTNSMALGDSSHRWSALHLGTGGITVNGSAGLSTTVVVPCGTLTFTAGVLTNKGAC